MGRVKAYYQEMLEAGEVFEGPEVDGPDPVVPQELVDAEWRVPNSKFVQSCRAFFEKRGFLSDAQKRALKFSGTPHRRYRQFSGYDPYDEES